MKSFCNISNIKLIVVSCILSIVQGSTTLYGRLILSNVLTYSNVNIQLYFIMLWVYKSAMRTKRHLKHKLNALNLRSSIKYFVEGLFCTYLSIRYTLAIGRIYWIYYEWPISSLVDASSCTRVSCNGYNMYFFYTSIIIIFSITIALSFIHITNRHHHYYCLHHRRLRHTSTSYVYVTVGLNCTQKVYVHVR